MAGLSRPEIYDIVNNYIGVHGGYLGDFSYRTHQEFYPLYGDLDIDPLKLEDLTTRERFVKILQESTPADQAKILRGILTRYPPSPNDPLRTQARADQIQKLIIRLDTGGLVSTPNPRITSDIVERAINDAETLIRDSGATSGVDRVHTALHGYLLAACDTQGIKYPSDPSLTALLKILMQQHPKLQDLGTRSTEVAQILRAFGAVLDALNPIRNRASVAHPNAALLGEDEAWLVINASRTILQYLDSKLS